MRLLEESLPSMARAERAERQISSLKVLSEMLLKLQLQLQLPVGSFLESVHGKNGCLACRQFFYAPIHSKPGESSTSTSLEAGL